VQSRIHEAEPAALSYGLNMLVQTRGLVSAKRVYARLARSHDAALRTALGNAILHGTVMRRRNSGASGLRGVLWALDELCRVHGFVPDRVTTNIVLKAALRWRAGFNSARLRALFDYLVREGYPAVPRYSPDTLPFASPSPDAAVAGMKLPMPPEPLSFFRHVRPLYKMLIKAFFVREDVVAARLLVGILKDVECIELDRKLEEKRSRASGDELEGWRR